MRRCLVRRARPVPVLAFLTAACAAMVVAAVCASGPVTTGGYWRPRGIPSSEIAYDPLRHRLLAVGSSVEDAELYELLLVPGATWQRLEAAGTRPEAAGARSFGYDWRHDRIVVQGGAQHADSCNRSFRSVTEASAWSLALAGGPAWTRIEDRPGEGAGMVADEARERFLVYGGFYRHLYAVHRLPVIDSLVPFRDLWQLDWAGGDWTRIGGEGPDMGSRRTLAAVDPVRDRLLVLAAAAPRTLWMLPLGDPTRWTEVAVAGTEPTRDFDRAEYDPGSDALLLFSRDSLTCIPLGSSPAWQAIPTAGSGATVRAWDPGLRRAWAYDAGGPVFELDATAGWAWTRLAAPPVPDSLLIDFLNLAVAYDGSRGRTLVMGGLKYVDLGSTPGCGEMGQELPNTDLWSIGATDGDGWHVQGASVQPGGGLLSIGIRDAGFAYDSRRDRLVLAAGSIYPEPGNDVWQLDLQGPSRWSVLETGGLRPPRRSIRASAYDSLADRALFLGGEPGDALWAIDFAAGGTWQSLPIADEPATRIDAWRCAWDPARRRMWLLDPGTMALSVIDVAGAAAWSPVPVTGTPPPAGDRCWLTLDTNRDRLVVLRDTPPPFLWEIPLAAPEWREVEVEGGPPDLGDGLALEYDRARDQALLIGGGYPGLRWRPNPYILRFDGDSPTAAAASLVSMDATPGSVRIEWRVAGTADATFALARSEDGAAWTPLAPPIAFGGDRVVMQDDSVRPGGRYAYRLMATESGSTRTLDQIWVVVPATWTLRLDGARPNPARGTLRLAFALADATPATLEVLDVQGRSCARTEVGALGAGEHVLAVAPERPLAPGLYFARLVTTRGVRLARFGVVR